MVEVQHHPVLLPLTITCLLGCESLLSGHEFQALLNIRCFDLTSPALIAADNIAAA